MEEYCFEEVSCMDVVKESWLADCPDKGIHRLIHKNNKVEKDLSNWSSSSFKNAKKKKKNWVNYKESLRCFKMLMSLRITWQVLETVK